MLQLGPNTWPSMVAVTEAETFALVHWMYETLILCQSSSNCAIMNSGCRTKRILRISLRELQLCCEIFRGLSLFFPSGSILRIARNLAGLLEWEDSSPFLTPVLLDCALAGKWEMMNYASISQLLLTKGFLPRYVSLFHPVCNY